MPARVLQSSAVSDEPKRANAQALRLRDWAAESRGLAAKMKTAGAQAGLLELAVACEAKAQQIEAAPGKGQPSGPAKPALEARSRFLSPSRELMMSIVNVARWQPQDQRQQAI